MEIEYIIVQAGGRGSRLGYVTDNKPKALAPVENLPMLFHLFRLFPDKRFVVIGDYKLDVFKRYLAVFAEVKYLMVDAGGEKGTCAGIRAALEYVPQNTPFMLIWSDLVLDSGFALPGQLGNYVGVSKVFPCRWKYEDGQFEEKPSGSQGVAGLFLFEDKSLLEGVTPSGEFVRWLQGQGLQLEEFPLYGIREYGLLEEYRKVGTQKCRPFNRLTFQEDKVVKEGIDGQGKALAVRERNWYQKAEEFGVRQIPHIYQLEPLVLERVRGQNVFEHSFTEEEKKDVLGKIILGLKELHKVQGIATDYFSVKEAYFTKTMHRLAKVRRLVPFADQQIIRINGKDCRNVYFYEAKLEEMLERIRPQVFCFIHGDCTFSNLMLDEKLDPVLIDPRGYFGFTEYYGDPLYDWAKLYYSLSGNYDRFNRGQFQLQIGEDEVCLTIESNGWEGQEEEFFHLLEGEAGRAEIKLLHAVIWLSLTTYAWEDYDSICGAFYNGLHYFEECLQEEEKERI